MIDVARERVITLNEAAGMLPGCGGNEHPHWQTLRRWASRGVRGVMLETVWAGGQRCTSREAVARFVSALTISRGRDDSDATERFSRGRRAEKARQRLAAEHGLT